MEAVEILTKAASLVGGDRQRTHGDKRANFDNIARLWNGYLRNIAAREGLSVRDAQAMELTAADVGSLMVLMKIARTQAGAFNPDDYVDAAGYAGCTGQVAQELEQDRLAARSIVDDAIERAAREGRLAS
jgi:hypothetical protein